ncbi:TetR family transcriptional regulator [Cellulosimicrobium sp. PMB13]|uniref:TetR/AcrR family transcriptional regulator n=1 Tax=Cellulosimicrobium sp. PMB13 TaxID=3120158 RepID=UPI003F4C25FB
MPRLVDHDERRRQITGAARRVVARDGLEAATFQAVAAEAGVSVRLVQYYFGNKEGLLLATHRAVIEDAAARFGGGPGQRPAGGPRDVLRGILAALLPLDAERRADAVVLAAFHAAALTGSTVEARAMLGAPRALVDVVAALLLGARPPGGDTQDPAEDPAEDDRAGTALDAELVLATAAGLVQGVLAGHYTPDAALALADHLLDRVLGPVSPSSSASAS